MLFFFQAEDGIRDIGVTGVQTCALPISPVHAGHLDLLPVARQLWKHRTGSARLATIEGAVCAVVRDDDLPGAFIPERYFGYLRSREPGGLRQVVRSEERRVGKECRSRWS